ncbi:MAG: aa3-type cytochrome c oxidase subunit IV [Alphaproteobacteria bacterium]|nr:aa3-type cytochrome c oxidase subunit IV [Alphaproteobacteria bacterium]
MAHDDELEFNRAPREHLQTYGNFGRLMTVATVLTVIVLALMAFFLV